VEKLPQCFIDLYKDWFNTHTGKDRKAIIKGAVWKTRNKSCFQIIWPGIL
jgi:hypothetical protein